MHPSTTEIGSIFKKEEKKVTGNKDQTGNGTKVAAKPRSCGTCEQRLTFQGSKRFTWNSEWIPWSRYLQNKRNHTETQVVSDLATSVWPCPKTQQITDTKIYYSMYS